MKNFSYIVLLLALALFSRCAQQTPISGGDRDITPPMIDTVKLEIPRNGSVNFVSKTIIVHFDEFVALQQPDKQIIITPFLKTKPLIYAQRKKVIIQFKDELESNTTYIINFGNSIVDLNEGNKFSNYKYVFSTGTFIDSLQYSAFVYDAKTKEPASEVLVMLYPQFEDSVVRNEKPRYFGSTNSSGVCSIANIAQGTYKVIALDDKNNNYKFDAKEERIGYIDQHFTATTDTVRDTLAIFLEQPKKLAILSSTLRTSGRGCIVTNKPFTETKNALSDSLTSIFLNKAYTITSSKDSVLYWIAPIIEENKNFPIKIGNSKPLKTHIRQPQDTVLSFSTNASRNLKPFENLSLTFSQPIQTIAQSKITLLANNETIDFELIKKSPEQIIIAADYKEDIDYTFSALPDAFVSEYGLTNDTIGALFIQNEANNYGTIIVTIEAETSHEFILELMLGDKIISRKQLTPSTMNKVAFNYLNKGKYKLRLVFDENKNALWDTGNYFEHIQPERIEYYEEEIDLKNGWDMEIKWKIIK